MDDQTVENRAVVTSDTGLAERWQQIPLYGRIIIGVILGVAAGLTLGSQAAFLAVPGKLVLRLLGALAPPLILAAIVHTFMTTRLGDNFAVEFKILLLAGFILAFPFILFEIWRFIPPALSAAIRRWGSIILISSVALFWCGVLFARLVTWGTVADFLVFQWLPPPIVLSATESVRPDINLTIADYLSFFTGFHLAFGLSFQLPIVSVLLGSIGVISSGLFFRYWRHAIVVLCLFSIVVMPPDVFAMLTLMLPMMGLYFISAVLVRLIEGRK